MRSCHPTLPLKFASLVSRALPGKLHLFFRRTGQQAWARSSREQPIDHHKSFQPSSFRIQTPPRRDSSISIIIITMASRILSPAMRAVASPSTAFWAARSFQTSSRRLADVAAPLPVRKPVGAFRGGSVIYPMLQPFQLLQSYPNCLQSFLLVEICHDPIS
jgi:hypothetical protein